MFLRRQGVQKVHIWLLGGIEMYPDIGVTKCCDGECSYRIEANGDGPEQKKGVEIHAVARESENALLYKGHVTVSWIEMVGAGSPYHSEVSLSAVHGIDSGQGKLNCYYCLREYIELEATTVVLSQCKQRNEATAK